MSAHRVRGARFIESGRASDKHTRFTKGGTWCHGGCRENNHSRSEVEEKKSAGKTRENNTSAKINGRCLRRFSVALAKTGSYRRGGIPHTWEKRQRYFGVRARD